MRLRRGEPGEENFLLPDILNVYLENGNGAFHLEHVGKYAWQYFEGDVDCYKYSL